MEVRIPYEKEHLYGRSAWDQIEMRAIGGMMRAEVGVRRRCDPCQISLDTFNRA